MQETNATRAALVASGSKLGGMVAVPFKVDAAVIEAAKKMAPHHHQAASPPAAAAGGNGSGDAAAAAAPAAEGDAASPASAPSPVPELTFIELAAGGETITLVASSNEPAMMQAQAVEAVKAAAAAAAAAPASPAVAGSSSSHSRVASGGFTPTSSGGAGTATAQPRFFLLRLGAASAPALLYYCPEGTAPRARMTYSTAKAPLLDALAAAGVGVGLVVEARDDDDVATAVGRVYAGEKAPAHPTAAASSGAGTAASPSSLASPGVGMRSPVRGGVALGGMVALPGMGMGAHALRSPATPTSAAAAAASVSGGSAHAAMSPGDDSFDKPTRPGRGGARVVGAVGLPGLSPRGPAGSS